MCVALAAALTATACQSPPDVAPTGGNLSVLGPSHEFQRALATGHLPPDWQIVGDVPPGAISINEVDGSLGLRIDGGGTSYAILRRTRASLLATPFLSWAWRATPPKRGEHPVRIYVGLRNRPAQTKQPWWQLGGNERPADRIITIDWAETALARGTIISPTRDEDGLSRVRYIARGGQEQGGRWWFDTIDLSQIHHQVWPNDDPAKMDVTLIGFAVAQASLPSTMYLASIALAR